MLRLTVNGHKVNAFPVVMLPSALLGALGFPYWGLVASANVVLLWTDGWGEALWGPVGVGQPTPFLRCLANLMPTLGLAAAVWTFHQPEPMAFWVSASIYFASVEWLSMKYLNLTSFVLGWLCLRGLSLGGHFEGSNWNCMLVYTCSVMLTLVPLHLAYGVERPGRIERLADLPNVEVRPGAASPQNQP